jgi:chorismate mutase
MDELILKREELLKLNQNIFEYIQTRKTIVNEIQKLKKKNSIYGCWDPKQEKKLFSHFSHIIKRCSLKELFAFSLLMEDHAMIYTQAYPAWSELEHLQSSNIVNAIHQINPILLAEFNKDYYDQLPLKIEMKILIDGVLKND